MHPQVSLSRGHPNATAKVMVDVMSLDSYVRSVNFQATRRDFCWKTWAWNVLQNWDLQGEVFLLKIDAEGFDPVVLRGAKELLRKHRVRPGNYFPSCAGLVMSRVWFRSGRFLLTKGVVFPADHFWLRGICSLKSTGPGPRRNMVSLCTRHGWVLPMACWKQKGQLDHG